MMRGAFADVFTDDGSMILPNDVFQQGHDAIRSFMTAAFAGPYRDTQVTGEPVDIRFLAPDVALVITRGGVPAGRGNHGRRRTWRAGHLGAGQTGRAAKLAAYQNTSTAAE